MKRAEWSKGVTPKQVVNHPVTYSGGAVSTVVLHHSVTGQSPFLGKVRAIERYHITGEYFDIAYNFLVSASDGFAVEGRGAVTQGGATGAGIDGQSLSVCAVGNFEADKVPTILVDNLVSLLSKLVVDGHVKPGFSLEPHSKYKATACCGKNLVVLIPEILRRVAATVAPVSVASSDAQKLAAIREILRS